MKTKSTYSEKLRDPRWQKKRLAIMERDDFSCVICKDANATLNVHHWKYKGEPWEAPDCYLSTLCEDCHSEISKEPHALIAEMGRILHDLMYEIAERNSKRVFERGTPVSTIVQGNDSDIKTTREDDGFESRLEEKITIRKYHETVLCLYSRYSAAARGLLKKGYWAEMEESK